MFYRLLAEMVVVLHLAFIVFVVGGSLLALKWPWVAMIHIPCVLWGAMIEFFRWYCPLTPLENKLRQATGGESYTGGFIEHYIVPLIYPGAITRNMQIALGVAVLAINLFSYLLIWWRHAPKV